MAYIQRSTPPPNTIMNFSLKSFVGGLNNRSEQLQANEASDLLNMVFDDDTVMAKRNGQVYYDDVTFTNPIVFIDEFRPYTDDPVLIRSTETEFFIEDVKLTNVHSKPCGVTYSGKYFFSDGEKLWVYGRFDQVTSTYCKVIGTPIDDYVLLEVTSPADGHTKLDTSHVKGVLNVDYTNYKVYYEPCQNEFEDTYKGANVVPTGPKYLVSHDGRLFMSGCEKDDDNIFISNVQNPYYFPVSLPIQIPPNSDEIVGMCIYDDSILIGRHNDLYVITGNTNKPGLGVDVFQLEKLNSHTGFATNNAVSVAHNYLFFLGNDGNSYAMSTTRTDTKTLVTSILSQQIDIEKTPININLENLNTACSVFYKDEWYLSVGDKTLVYSYRHKAWTMFNNLNVTSMYIKDRELIWCNTSGRTAMFGEEYMDFDKPFNAFWVSKSFDMDEANTYKQFREFYLVAHTFSGFVSDINVTFEIDYVDVKDKYTVSNQISVFGKATWGSRFINRNIVNSIPFVIGRRGRNIKFKFSNSYFIKDTVADLDALAYHQKQDGILVYVTAESAYYLCSNLDWVLLTYADLNQAMKIYQVNGDYELRGKR